MTLTSADIDQATTVDFFSRMNAAGVEYAVLRNYELYPKFGHDIDLIVRWSDLSRWRSIAAACASEHRWDALTECDHWAQSSSREHTIQILRFYKTSPLGYLQIDAFHSFLLNGLPLFDEAALLGGRIWDERGFFRIDERAENFFRLLQIAKLAGSKSAADKLTQYRDRALVFWSTANVNAFAADIGLPEIAAAMQHLTSGDLHSFKAEIERQKRAWWMSRIAVHPVQSSRMIVNRFADYLRLFWLRPCGFKVRVFTANNEQRSLLEKILNRLIGANLIPAFTVDGSAKKIRRVLERGGLAVEWAATESAEVVLNGAVDEEIATTTLITKLIERHPLTLDRRESAH